MIYKELDKNNGRLNRRLMLRFRKVLNQLEVKEVDLVGKRFTWSNNQDTPTLTRIDRAFCTLDWEELYSNPILQALSSSHSDNCPLLLMPLVPLLPDPGSGLSPTGCTCQASLSVSVMHGQRLCQKIKILLGCST
jgi:hypothetical protein